MIGIENGKLLMRIMEFGIVMIVDGMSYILVLDCLQWFNKFLEEKL